MSFDFTESVTLILPNVKDQMASFAESDGYRQNNKLITEIAAIHAGLTSNFNMYTAEALEGSLSSWVTPYARPIIMNHDEYSEPVGRVMASRMEAEEDGTRYVRLQVGITDPAAIEKIADGRYLTGSVGGSALSAKCSICNVDWAKEDVGASGMPCRHKRGKVYEGQLAYFELGDLSFREYSFVNIPADQHSGIRSTKNDAENALAPAEGDDSEWTHTVKMYSMDMNNQSVVEMSESHKPHNILESYKKKDAASIYMNLKGTFLSVSALDCRENDEENGDFTGSSNTITNEFDPNSDKLDESRKEKAMSGKNTDVTEQEDDVLAVTEQLSADLAAADEGEASNTTEDLEESETDENAEELSEGSDVKADTEDSEEDDDSESEEDDVEDEQLTSEEDTEQADVDAEIASESDLDPEGSEKPADDEKADEDEEEEVEESDDSALAELNSTIDTLKEENAKLRGALHRMLVERVVDAKIAKGVEESAERATLIEEHSKRTASSLADALRDLDRYQAKAPRATEAVVPEMENRSGALGSEKGATVSEDIEEDVKPVDGFKVAEDRFTDAMMGRLKLR